MDDFLLGSQTQEQSPLAAHDPDYIENATFNNDLTVTTTDGSQSARWMLTLWPEYLPRGGIDWHVTDRSNWPEMPLYMCWGQERCPDTGRVHYHIYCRFQKRYRCKQIRDNFPSQSTWAFLCKGTEQQCRDYCWSQGNHTGKRRLRMADWGEYNANVFQPDSGKQGARNDLQHATELVLQGSDMRAIAEAHPTTYVRYHQGLEALKRTTAPQPPAVRSVSVYFLWGPTGTGKTTRVLQQFPEAYSVTKTSLLQSHVWDEYTGQETLLLDEWRSSAWSIQEMNRVLDKFRLSLMCRYRNSYAAWTRIFICSNDTPTQSFPEEPDMVRQAFLRRIEGRTYLVDQREDKGGPSLDFIMRHLDIPTPI